MKITTFFATVVFVSCGLNSIYGQVQTLRGFGQPSPAPSLVSGQNSIPNAEETSSPSLDNPFDYLDAAEPVGLEDESSPSDQTQIAPSVNIDIAPSIDSEFSSEDSVLVRSESAPTQPSPDPHSIPSGRPTLVDSILTQSSLEGVLDCTESPVDWSMGVRTPNPVASILLREQCVQGLWNGYDAQRAAECAAMWEKLYGHQRCNYCVAPAPACTPKTRPRNRYRERAAGCDTQSGGTPCASNSITAPSTRLQELEAPQVQTVSTPSYQEPPISPATRHKVAQFPDHLIR